MIDEPTGPVDWAALRDLQGKAFDLQQAGKLDVAAWEAIMVRARKAAHGQPAPLQSLEMVRPTA